MAYQKEKVFKEILAKIAEGSSLRSILSGKDTPNRSTFFEWVLEDKEKANQYARACELRAETIFEDIMDIADETSRDTITTEKGEIPNNEWINRSRLKVDARKWMLSKMNPKKYGDKIEATLQGGDKPISINFED